jgi:putative ABC transport system substrate-binding protein
MLLSRHTKMQRREFITLFGGAAAWPLAARSQQADRMRRIGWLAAGDENDPEPVVSVFTQALANLGWTDGRNVRMDLRWWGMTSIGYQRSRRSWWACNPTHPDGLDPGDNCPPA